MAAVHVQLVRDALAGAPDVRPRMATVLQALGGQHAIGGGRRWCCKRSRNGHD